MEPALERHSDAPNHPPNGSPNDPAADSPADPESVARAICLRLLTGRAHSRSELAAALDRRLVPPAAAEAVLDRLMEVGLINDSAFAAAWVSSRHAGRGLAGRALTAELRARGVAPEIVAAAVGGLDSSTEEETARRLVRRRLAGLQRVGPEVRARRLVGLLARKGYSPGLAGQIVRSVLAEDGAA